MQAAPCPPAQHAFGCLVSGRPVAYSDSFQQVEATKWSIDIENSQQIRDVVVFLTQPLNMPGMGMSCYITGTNLPIGVDRNACGPNHWKGLLLIVLTPEHAAPRLRWANAQGLPSPSGTL